MRAKESRVFTGVVSTGLGGNKQQELITIWGNRVRDLMETDGRFWPHHGWGVCPDANQVFVLAQNTKVGTDAQVP